MRFGGCEKRNRKGDISLEFVIKLVIAALCIVALVYLAFSFYGLFTQKTRIEQAKATLGDIDVLVKNLEEGKSAEYLILAPFEWNLGFYVVGRSIQFPKQCAGVNCICICEDAGWESCDESGVCRAISGAKELNPSLNEQWKELSPVPVKITLTKTGGVLDAGF